MRRSSSKMMLANERYQIFFYEPGNHTEILIREADEYDYAKRRRAFLKSIDHPDLEEQYDPDEDVSVTCRRTNWARTVHSTCHAFHEIAMDEALYQEQVEHLGTGTYRDAWWFRPANVVYKTTILADPELQFDAKRFTQILTDANIMEALTTSNRITEIYMDIVEVRS
jgi:hypothetical protein